MSKESKNEDGTIEFKKSMTVEETRSMSIEDTVNPEDYIDLFKQLKNKENKKN